ncbi:DUF5924 family protein [Fontimonas sp. SYSU GA230001]|uniref:DUF5924 family protein n=1 Tax=Fontimonas sp. SYSU GA230001 TaxID=3142450 RepID=UPI0032B55325
MTAAPPPAGRWRALWDRWRHAIAALSFLGGIASFALISRQERVAQALVILLPLSWLLAACEPALLRLADERPRWRPPPWLLGYAAQALHQESLFFTLPFFFATTAWASPHLLFTATMTLLALMTITDPLYYRHVLPRRAAVWGLHAVSGFVTALTAAPMLWHLTTAQSLGLALACLGIVSVPAWHALLARAPLRLPLAVLLALALAGLGWQLRTMIPPATLWVADMRMTASVDPAARSAGPAIRDIAAEDLRRHGLYAWTSIRVPRGLRERVEHHWRLDGRTIDVVTLDVSGGREAGYRAWSRKTVFPADPRGRWEVRVVTHSGQLLGLARFTVH